MRSYRYRCFGPSWPYKYAAVWVSNGASPCHDGAADAAGRRHGPWYASREHGHRGRRSGSFGVRRPLRFLSYQLDLDEPQRRRIATVLDGVKVEREQAQLDEKKMVAEVAELLAKPDVSAETLRDALSARVKSAEQVQAHVATALHEIVSVLDPDQREEFAYLLRNGAFRI